MAVAQCLRRSGIKGRLRFGDDGQRDAFRGVAAEVEASRAPHLAPSGFAGVPIDFEVALQLERAMLGAKHPEIGDTPPEQPGQRAAVGVVGMSHHDEGCVRSFGDLQRRGLGWRKDHAIRLGKELRARPRRPVIDERHLPVEQFREGDDRTRVLAGAEDREMRRRRDHVEKDVEAAANDASPRPFGAALGFDFSSQARYFSVLRPIGAELVALRSGRRHDGRDALRRRPEVSPCQQIQHLRSQRSWIEALQKNVELALAAKTMAQHPVEGMAHVERDDPRGVVGQNFES